MSSYRFCRTDDMPLLVEAYNRAFLPHVAGLAALDRDGLKRWIRDVDLWCSSCMIARDDAGELIGVLLGCKRPTETLILAVGVHPDHVRHGHGRHLVTSLSSKLSILGPPRLVAEVPAEDTRARAFFEACGFTVETRLRDYALDPSAAGARPSPELVARVSVDDLIAAGVLAANAPRPWSRDVAALAKRRDVLGLAIASPDRIEAWILWRETEDGREIQGLGTAGSGASLAALLGHLAAASASPARLPRVTEDELRGLDLEALGFRRGLSRVRYAAVAKPA